MRINFKNKLTAEDSYVPVKEQIKGELNQKLADCLITLFASYSKYVTLYSPVKEGFKPNFWSDYTDGPYTKLLGWKMFLRSDLPFKNQDVINIEFGDNNGYDEGDYRDEYYFEDGVRLYHMTLEDDFEDIVITYKLFINYAVLLRNTYEMQLKESGKSLEEVEQEMKGIDKLIEEYCIKYNVEVVEDFYSLYDNLSDYIIRILEPKEYFKGIEMPDNIEIVRFKRNR